MSEILTKPHVDEIARQCGEMLNEGTINLIQSEMFEDLIVSHDTLLTAIEARQQVIDQQSKEIKRLQWAASNAYDKLNQLKSDDVEEAKQFLYKALT